MHTRRQFQLSADDQFALNRLQLRWESLVDQGRQWVLIYGFALPAGFVQTLVDLAVEIAGGYPVGQLDMANFSPAIAMPSGRAIAQTNVTEQIDGKPWQRWSRHRTEDNAWRPGEDCLDTHIDFVVGFLGEEVRRGA